MSREEQEAAMYLLAHEIDHHVKQIEALTHQAPEPSAAALWTLQALAGRTGLHIVVLGHQAAALERIKVAGAEVLDGLRDGLAIREAAKGTEEAAWDVVDALAEELVAHTLGDDDDGGADLEWGWGMTAMR